MGFPGGSVVKNLPTNTGDTGSIPGLGRSPGEENGNPFWYSCLENPIDRGAWQDSSWCPKELDMTELLNNNSIIGKKRVVQTDPDPTLVL